MSALLLNPGPVTLTERVRKAMLRPDLCHREPEFSELQQSIRRKILQVYALDPSLWAATLLTGSGTAAVEAMITSFVPADGKLLVLENGVYGERMRRIAERHGIAVTAVHGAWGATLDIDEINHAVNGDPAISHVAVVHHETTTGRLNDLHELGDICRTRDIPVLCDAVSSFGAEYIDFDGGAIAACAATANKCLHGVPGTAFVVCDRQALARAGACARSVYLDLAAYVAQQDAGGTPFTQSVQTFYALDEALDEFFEAGGVEARHAVYRRRIERVREALVELGVTPMLTDDDTSCVLHAFGLPAGLDYERLHGELKSRGFVIYAGQGAFADRIFRISTMGAIEEPDIERLVAALKAVISG